MNTGDVTIPAIVVESVGADGWVSIESTPTGWSAEMWLKKGADHRLVDAPGATWQEALDALAETLREETS